MKNKWFEVKNQTEDSSDLYFYGDIVNSDIQKWDDDDTTASNVRDFISSIHENSKLNIYINSGGGIVTTGMAIYNILKRHKGHKTVHIDGIAASISSIIAFVGDKLVMPKTSYLMVHLPWVFTMGNRHELLRAQNTLETIESNMMEVYFENLKDEGDRDKVRSMVENETWLTGEEASNLFNVELVDGFQAVACATDMVKMYKNPPEAVNKTEPPMRQEPKQETFNKIKFQNELDLIGL